MADIGSTLREARMRSRIDISEVEAATKIRAKYLRALENEEWDLLPGPTYAKSFLRTYGNYLGLDSRMLTDEFRQRYEGPSDNELRSVTSLARERERASRRRRVPPWASIALAVVVLAGVLYAVGSATNSSPSMPAGQNAGRHKATHHAHHRVTITTAPRRPTSVTLSMVPTGTVYVCLVNGAGQKLINAENFAVGQTIPTQHGRHLLLTLGNNSIQVKVNRRSVPVASSANAIRLEITPHGVSHIPLSKPPACP